MLRNGMIVALCLLALGTVAVRPAEAQYCGPGSFYGYTPFTVTSVPYYISHPPIYYNHTMLRPVDPWCAIRPETVAVQAAPEPLLVVNPYVVTPEVIPTPPKVSVKPQRVKNPYVAKNL
jgi:hypothetical protein